jgi:hypothetical protein
MPRVLCCVLQLHEDGGEDEDEGEDGVVSYREWQLPAADFEGSWDALWYESSIKKRLMQYASSALLFSDLGVNNQLISWNRWAVLWVGLVGGGEFRQAEVWVSSYACWQKSAG